MHIIYICKQFFKCLFATIYPLEIHSGRFTLQRHTERGLKYLSLLPKWQHEIQRSQFSIMAREKKRFQQKHIHYDYVFNYKITKETYVNSPGMAVMAKYPIVTI